MSRDKESSQLPIPKTLVWAHSICTFELLDKALNDPSIISIGELTLCFDDKVIYVLKKTKKINHVVIYHGLFPLPTPLMSLIQ